MEIKDEVNEIKSLQRWIQRKMLNHETIMEREEISYEVTLETIEISLEMLQQEWLLRWRNQCLQIEKIILEKEQRIMEEQMQRKSHEEIRLSYHW